MHRYLALQLTVVLAGATLATSAMAATSASSAGSGGGSVLIETKPLPYITNLVPGVSHANVGLEFALGRRFSLRADYSQLRINLSQSSVDTYTADSKNADKVLITEGSSRAIGVGLRLDSNAHGDTWYLGVGGSQETVASKMIYGSTEVTATAKSFMPAIDTGYRWVWNSGFALRLGLGMQEAPKYEYTTAATDAEGTDQANKAVTAARNSNNDGHWLANLDFGLGWMF